MGGDQGRTEHGTPLKSEEKNVGALLLRAGLAYPFPIDEMSQVIGFIFWRRDPFFIGGWCGVEGCRCPVGRRRFADQGTVSGAARRCFLEFGGS